ncbi:MAG: tRNA pseudouridine(38-40) synthase TruA [Clostridiales bacterium]|jgi:tRNA pseudouridine38-40 synthase|nr:tRNA pseudouridine(38-40) synthase TruA [Clostridiales bacterium]
MHILLTLSYEGTCYGGWQRQANAVTVQEKLEEALARVFQTPIPVTGASRTDAGVHALGQAASFHIENAKIPLAKMPVVLNRCLPEDIVVTEARQVADSFSPRFDAKEKTYRYQIWHNRFPNPLLRRTALFFPYPLDMDQMVEAAPHFVGRHDFAAFRAAGSSAKTTVRELYACGLTRTDSIITLTVCGGGFLYNMVRIIAGTLLYVGQNKIQPDAIGAIMDSRDRTRAGKTVPPHGLTLLEIKY